MTPIAKVGVILGIAILGLCFYGASHVILTHGTDALGNLLCAPGNVAMAQNRNICQQDDDVVVNGILYASSGINLRLGTVARDDTIDFGSGANDDLSATDVTDLTDGGASTLHSHAGGSTPWTSLHDFGRTTITNIPAGVIEVSRATGSSYGRGRVDLTNYTNMRLAADHILVQCAPDGDLYMQYSTDQTTWLTLGGGPDTGDALDCTTALGQKVSAFFAIPAGAKSDVFVRVLSEGGDAVDDPQFTGMMLQVN